MPFFRQGLCMSDVGAKLFDICAMLFPSHPYKKCFALTGDLNKSKMVLGWD